MIPFKRVNLGNAYEEVKPLFESGFIGLGKEVFKFEQELAKYVGAKYVIATDSCTSALFLSLKYENKSGKGNVSIPSMTVPLVANACFEAGLTISFNAETNWVGSAYQIIGSDVVDSAHELRRGQYRGGKMCFSFYPTKPIGSADGGAIATDNKEFANWARSISTYGRNQKAKYGNSWDYDVEMVGYKRHYTNLQAAICIEQLNRLDSTNGKRRKIREAYNNAFGYKNISDYLYRINIENRDGFIAYMAEKEIECGVHFKPLHLMTPFKNIPMTEEDKNKVEDAYSKTVSLPFYDLMEDSQIYEVIEAVFHFKDGKLLP
jgi:dTDP-4-amino-4,6-dideoxygalactose transaminase